MRVDIGQPHVDFGNPVRVVRGFGLLEQRRTFLVGAQHHVEHAHLAGRRFLRNGPDPRPLVELDRSLLRR